MRLERSAARVRAMAAAAPATRLARSLPAMRSVGGLMRREATALLERGRALFPPPVTLARTARSATTAIVPVTVHARGDARRAPMRTAGRRWGRWIERRHGAAGDAAAGGTATAGPWMTSWRAAESSPQKS
jgi:hypothetical protein